ncbi:MAG: hypothetical protein PHN38_04320 [Sulfurospirillaceae bacterium]|nr:hypothetical protein [Sulfurospirillaceae bacterium]MDD3463750.1 hypothetical protein [Sulfurospirillaceae bacterium]
MQENYLVIVIIATIVFVVFLLALILASLKSDSEGEKRKREIAEEDAKKSIGIEYFVELVAKRTTSKNELTNAVLEVSKNIPFPKKSKGRAPNKAKVYLNFVLLVASHKNADAKLIAFMDQELKKYNPDYRTEIDIYENEGLRQRANRI